MRKLRDKVDRRAVEHSFIQTRYGVGYKLEAMPKAAASEPVGAGSHPAREAVAKVSSALRAPA